MDEATLMKRTFLSSFDLEKQNRHMADLDAVSTLPSCHIVLSRDFCSARFLLLMKQLLDMNFAKLREKIGFDRWVLVMVLPPKGVQDSHGMSCFSFESKEFLSTLWCGWKQPLYWSCVIIEHIELIEWEHFNVPAECMECIDDRSLVGKLSSDNFSSFSAGPLNHWVPKLPNSFQIYAMLQLVKRWSVQKSGTFATAQNVFVSTEFSKSGEVHRAWRTRWKLVRLLLPKSPKSNLCARIFGKLTSNSCNWNRFCRPGWQVFSVHSFKSWVSSRQPEPKGWPRWMGDLVPKV